MSILNIKNLIYEYFRRDDDGEISSIVPAVNDVTLSVNEGDFISILGHNGSGKSTLAKHINGLLLPSSGAVSVNGIDVSDDNLIWEIRSNTGMVFQNPDNQIVGTIVEEDVAFGPENLGIKTEEIWNRVLSSLDAVGMSAYARYSPNNLSGGQKQRVAIAGVLAMEPKIIVLDESTAMLDPEGRKNVLETVARLNKEKKITIILITHYMEEVLYSNKVFVMNKGQLVMSGAPRDIFSSYEELVSYGLEVPDITKAAYLLKYNGLNIDNGILTYKELVDNLVKLDIKNDNRNHKNKKEAFKKEFSPNVGIVLDSVSYTYGRGDSDKPAICDVSLNIRVGEIVGVVGHTGSGKSTLMQHLNGLLKPTKGDVYFNGEDISDKNYDIKKLRQKVGIVFQYPEHQLFGETVYKDVYFGPSNMNLTQIEAQKRTFDAIATVGLSDELYDVSPFQLSGGQKRKVAIAGVIAMEPEYLVLDEPAAGLDPKGKKEIFDLLSRLNKEHNITIVIVSHSMEDIAEYVDRVIVMNEGQIKYDDTPDKVFRNYKELEKLHLAAPKITYIMNYLSESGINVSTDIYRLSDGVDEILSIYKG